MLSGKLEGKRLFRRLRHPSDSNIKIDFNEIGLKGENCILLAQQRAKWWALVNTVV
jgi:hypothetical protein